MNDSLSDIISEEDPVLHIYNPAGSPLPVDEATLSRILKDIESREEIRFSLLELVLVDEDGIIDINRKYLNKEYITDIISFRYDEGDTLRSIEGTLFCCMPRIHEQAGEYDVPASRELLRVFIHGLLHLAGYDDKTEPEKERMTRREDYYLSRTDS